MSKYEPIKRFLESIPTSERRMTFTEIERILGFPLPPAARRHRPWWSNNGNNNVMTKAWLDAGFRTEQVDMAGETLVFSKKAPGPGNRSNAMLTEVKGDAGSKRSPYGGLAGTVRIAPGVDITEPTGEVWAAEQGQL